MRNPVVMLVFAAFLAHAQSSVYRGPRAADGKPNLNGIWQAMNT
jgi:hypothetical protein